MSLFYTHFYDPQLLLNQQQSYFCEYIKQTVGCSGDPSPVFGVSKSCFEPAT